MICGAYCSHHTNYYFLRIYDFMVDEMMTRAEMIMFVEDQLKKIPNDKINAIRLLAFALGEDDPQYPEHWYQQKIGGE